MPRVELISNISHYYYTALALDQRGYLGSYITGPCALDSEEWMGRCGGPLARLWAERRLKGISPHKVKRMWLPEIVQKAIKKIGGTGGQSNWTHNELFARGAARRMGECDAIHFVHSVGREAARKAKRNGATVVCDIREEHPQFQHDILSDEAGRLGIEFHGAGARYSNRVLEELDIADRIFCPSAYAKATFVARAIDADKIAVCPYGVDIESFTPAPVQVDRGAFTVLFLGNVCMRKGIHYLLEGFQRAKLGNARLLLAGPVDPTFRPILRRYEGQFEEVGRVPRAQVGALYRRADAFVIPSLADVGPLVALEAMSTGLPVVVSENTGVAELMTPYVDGLVVPIRDARSIAESLTYLHENADRRIAMGAAAAARVREVSWERYREICGDFYDGLFRSGAGAQAERRNLLSA